VTHIYIKPSSNQCSLPHAQRAPHGRLRPNGVMGNLRGTAFHLDEDLLATVRVFGKDGPKCLQFPRSYSRLLSKVYSDALRVGLLVTERDHGIDANGAVRGDVAREDRDEDEYASHRGKRCRIAGAYGE
jgi:hypothetical protein